MDSELANLDSQIQMQQESVEAKDTEMRKIRDQLNQVVLFQHADLTAGLTLRLPLKLYCQIC